MQISALFWFENWYFSTFENTQERLRPDKGRAFLCLRMWAYQCLESGRNGSCVLFVFIVDNEKIIQQKSHKKINEVWYEKSWYKNPLYISIIFPFAIIIVMCYCEYW